MGTSILRRAALAASAFATLLCPSAAAQAELAQQAYLKASNTGTNDQFGCSVSVSGRTLVVGALDEDSAATGVDGDASNNGAPRSGAAYVFVRSGPTWAHRAYLKASNTDQNDNFGYAVAVDGDTIVVGARQESSGFAGNPNDDSQFSAGAAYVFVRQGGTWTQQAYLKAAYPDAGDGFGWSVALSGDTIVVGSPNEDGGSTGVDGDQSSDSALQSGAAYVFVRNGTSWTQRAYLKGSNTELSDNFGYSVSMSGETIVVGARFEAGGATGVDGDETDNSAQYAGAAYVFVRSGTTWVQQAYLKASNTDWGDAFGTSVAVSGETVAVGAPYERSSAVGLDGNQSDDSLVTAGAAYVFVRNGSTWSQQAYVKASNTDTTDFFGASIAVSGDALVVGALGEESRATGIDGDQVDDSASDAGAAYHYARFGTTWVQTAYCKASNTAANDAFGWSVSVSGDTCVVGANDEDSSATGVDGDQSDNNYPRSGAAYVLVARRDIVPFCAGDGTGAACPCGNESVAGEREGCRSSLGIGAQLRGAGTPGLANDTLVLLGTDMPDSSALYFQGTADLAGGAGAVFGDGLRCAGGTVLRLATKFNAGGASQFPGPGDPSVSARSATLGGPLAVGATRHYQVWYRNSAAFCTSSTFNLTNGIRVEWEG